MLASILAPPHANVEEQDFTSVQVHLTVLKHVLKFCSHVNIIAGQVKEKIQSFTSFRFKISAAISKRLKK